MSHPFWRKKLLSFGARLRNPSRARRRGATRYRLPRPNFPSDQGVDSVTADGLSRAQRGSPGQEVHPPVPCPGPRSGHPCIECQPPLRPLSLSAGSAGVRPVACNRFGHILFLPVSRRLTGPSGNAHSSDFYQRSRLQLSPSGVYISTSNGKLSQFRSFQVGLEIGVLVTPLKTGHKHSSSRETLYSTRNTFLALNTKIFVIEFPGD